MEKNAKIGKFFYKERKRTQRSERSFVKNGKERKDRNVLLKRRNAQPWLADIRPRSEAGGGGPPRRALPDGHCLKSGYQ